MPETWSNTAGGTAAKIRVRIVSIIGVDIELAVAGIPVRVDETSARPLVVLLYPARVETVMCIKALKLQCKTAILYNFIGRIYERLRSHYLNASFTMCSDFGRNTLLFG